MDTFLNNDVCVDRLVREYNTHKSLIVAYDFDNTVFDFHNKGYRFDNVIEIIRQCREMGFYLIVYSCSKEERYPFIEKYLNDNRIPFDTINNNSPNIDFAYGKLYYNILLDDRCGLKSAYEQLLKTIKIINKEGEINNEN